MTGIPWHRLDDLDRQIIAFFYRYHRENGTYPTVREIQAAIPGLNSTSSVKYRLDRLVELKILERKYAKGRRASRAYRLALQPYLPVLGYIIAGDSIRPVFTADFARPRMPWEMEQAEDVVFLDGFVPQAPLEQYFALRVRGDSMVDEHILDGDVVVFRRLDAPPPPNTLVAVWLEDPVEGETFTLKRYRGPTPGRPGYLRFTPANRAKGLKPIDVPSQGVRFQGQAVWLIRSFAAPREEV